MAQPRNPRALARRHSASAVETLQTISAHGKSEEARVSAAVALLEFAHGRLEAKSAHAEDEAECDGATS